VKCLQQFKDVRPVLGDLGFGQTKPNSRSVNGAKAFQSDNAAGEALLNFFE